jgi:hypothetical protein
MRRFANRDLGARLFRLRRLLLLLRLVRLRPSPLLVQWDLSGQQVRLRPLLRLLRSRLALLLLLLHLLVLLVL